METCITCNSTSLIYDMGYSFCRSCGSRNKQIYQKGADQSRKGELGGKDRDRAGFIYNQNLPEYSMATKVGYLKGRKFYSMQKHHKWNTGTYKERSLLNVYNIITTFGNRGKMKKRVIDKAKEYYTIFAKNATTRGGNRKGIIASCVFLSCKINKIIRSPREIAKLFDISVRNVTRGTKNLSMILHRQNRIPPVLTVSKALDFIVRFCNQIPLDNLSRKAMRVGKVVDKYKILSNHGPQSLAAGIISFVAVFTKTPYDKKQMEKVCQNSHVTIGKIQKKLMRIVKNGRL